jgi:hypothetical protein
MNEKRKPTLTDYCEAMRRYLAAIDKVLSDGRVTQERIDAFYRTHDLVPGFGEKALTSAALPPSQRETHRRLIELNTGLYQRGLLRHTLKPRMSAPAAIRALGHRHRL